MNCVITTAILKFSLPCCMISTVVPTSLQHPQFLLVREALLAKPWSTSGDWMIILPEPPLSACFQQHRHISVHISISLFHISISLSNTSILKATSAYYKPARLLIKFRPSERILRHFRLCKFWKDLLWTNILVCNHCISRKNNYIWYLHQCKHIFFSL